MFRVQKRRDSAALVGVSARARRWRSDCFQFAPVPAKICQKDANGRRRGRVVMNNVSLIVMEQGGAWPGRVGDSENVVAVHDDKEALL